VVHDSLSSLARKGVISRVRSGVYVKASPRLLYDRLQQFESPILVAAKIAERDYYIAYLSAMQFHGVAEQVPFRVYVAIPGRRRNFRYGDYEVRFVNMSKRKFFGYGKEKLGGDYIYVSDKEKTIIDCLDRAEYAGGYEGAESMIRELMLKEKINWNRLRDYAFRIGEQALIHRLGYVLEQLSEKAEVPQGIIREFEKRVKPQVYYLVKNEKGRYVRKWQLIVAEAEEVGV
jgi:predicted transcriptional regulator of viral defense system